MPFTGSDFNRQLDIKTDYAYTGYYDIPKKNVIVREATTKAVEIKVGTNDRVQVQDDLFAIYKSNVPFTLVSNQISLVPGGSGISDYHHTMNLKARFIELFENVRITAATNTTPIRITIDKEINLRTGEAVSINNVSGNTATNGTRYVRRYKNDTFSLFSDSNLMIPVAGNGLFLSGVSSSISRIKYATADNLKSGRKFSTLSAATTDDPFYEIASGVMKIYPLEKPCTQILLDYISMPLYPDLGDSTIDLLATYSQRFIDFLIDETARLMGMDLRDQQLAAQSQAEIVQQP